VPSKRVKIKTKKRRKNKKNKRVYFSSLPLRLLSLNSNLKRGEIPHSTFKNYFLVIASVSEAIS